VPYLHSGDYYIESSNGIAANSPDMPLLAVVVAIALTALGRLPEIGTLPAAEAPARRH
jgi:hypothetical protein